MRRLGAIFGLIALTLAACGPPQRPPPPYFVIPAGPAAQAKAAPVPEGAPGDAPIVPRNPSIQYFLPSHPEDFERSAAPVPRPSAPSPFYAAPINPGPVTGYGPGGMALPPGSPPNPPYPPGGLTGIR